MGWSAAGYTEALTCHSKFSVVLPAGQRIGAAEAERIGLVSRVVPAAELMAEARKVTPNVGGWAWLLAACNRAVHLHLLSGVAIPLQEYDHRTTPSLPLTFN